jgi:Alpha-tubulin suppressor and related RCC1 domain-containing proteins
MGKVGMLAKNADISLAKLCVFFSTSGEAGIFDTIPISGNGQINVTKTYEGLASQKTWTLSVNSLDLKDSVVHGGSTTFDVQPMQTTNVSLSLSARFSMLKANFFPIRDSVTRCELLVDGIKVDDSSFAKQSAVGSTVQLAYNYLSTGIAKRIKMDVYGDFKGIVTLLYTGDTLVTAIAGENKSYSINLLWVGPTTPAPGQAYMTVVLGTIGTETINGKLLRGSTKSIASCESHNLVLKIDGTLWGCGYNAAGELGDGTTTDRHSLIHIMDSVQSMDAGSNHSLILKTDGTLWGCGSNGTGQLGDGTIIPRFSPIKMMNGVQSVAAGWGHSLILKTDGTLWACGDNTYGQLGDGTTTNRYSPVQIMAGVQSIAAREDHSMVLKIDGTLWACGHNDYGQLGDGTTTNRSSPIQIMTGVQSMAAGYYHSLILKTDGTLWACGYNGYGQLGLGDGTAVYEQLSPVQIMVGVQSMSAGWMHSLILKTDGTLWTCGWNGKGQLGIGTADNYVYPTPVQIMTDVQSTAAGGISSLIIKTDGTLWACGWNNVGQLGDGTTTDRLNLVIIYY